MLSAIVNVFHRLAGEIRMDSESGTAETAIIANLVAALTCTALRNVVTSVLAPG